MPATRSRSSRASELFREGAAGRLLVGPRSTGAIDALRHVGREEIVSGAMDAPGRWAGGFRGLGRARRLPRHRRGAGPGGCCGCPPSAARAGRAVVPVRRAPHRGARTARPAASRRRPASARRWSRSARWPPAWRTRSTTPRPRPPGAVDAPARPRARRCWRPSARLAEATDLRRRSSSRSTRCAGRSTRRPRRWTRWRSPTARRRCRTGWPARRRARLAASRPRSPPPASTTAWCDAGRRAARRRRARRPAWGGSPARCSTAACSPR